MNFLCFILGVLIDLDLNIGCGALEIRREFLDFESGGEVMQKNKFLKHIIAMINNSMEDKNIKFV